MDRTQLQFNLYCCKSMRNCKINYLKRNKQTMEMQPDTTPINDTYFRVCVKVGNEKFMFSDMTLIECLKKITCTKRTILLYYYCAEMCDIDIAKRLRLPRSTINYNRRQALIELKELYEGMVQ